MSVACVVGTYSHLYLLLQCVVRAWWGLFESGGETNIGVAAGFIHETYNSTTTLVADGSGPVPELRPITSN